MAIIWCNAPGASILDFLGINHTYLKNPSIETVNLKGIPKSCDCTIEGDFVAEAMEYGYGSYDLCHMQSGRWCTCRPNEHPDRFVDKLGMSNPDADNLAEWLKENFAG